MVSQKKGETGIQFSWTKTTLLLYSLFLAVGSVSLFITLIQLYTAYQGYIWSYTAKYVINSLATALVLLIASGLFLMGCYQMVKGRRFPNILGAIACVILIIYPSYVFLIDSYVPYAFQYVLILWIPAFVVLFIVMYVWATKRITE